ncbi:hypothetical protein [Vreelandella hamiltonii]|uniref:hypothetical protein n=1 Tax=Vreelandella hamiltonii TaxID=502829 RepID=UPI001E37CE65|nr:hypothetical protein [Halomonas hamiltonii]
MFIVRSGESRRRFPFYLVLGEFSGFGFMVLINKRHKAYFKGGQEKMEVKAEILKNRIVFTANNNTVVVEPKEPFTTTRLLVGTFMPAVECMKEGLAKVGAKGLFKRKPKLLIYPRAMTEGGLSEVEERCLLEVGHAAGAGKVEVHV